MVDPFAEDEHDDPGHDPFALAGNEIRMGIIRELGRAQGRRGPPAELPFAELRSRVGPDMDSGRFNYHLQELVNHLVRKAEDGYRLSPEGTTLYRTLEAGAFEDHRSVDPVPVGTDCHFCSTGIEALYDEGRFTIRCPDCEHFYYRYTMPPTAVESGITPALLERCARHERHLLVAATGGVCPICLGELDRQLLPADDLELLGNTTDHVEVYAHASCEHCGHQHYMLVGSALLTHPALVAFFHERGLDVTATPTWELPFAATDQHTTVRDTDPWEVAVTVSRSGDTLELVVDGSLKVREQTVS